MSEGENYVPTTMEKKEEKSIQGIVLAIAVQEGSDDISRQTATPSKKEHEQPEQQHEQDTSSQKSKEQEQQPFWHKWNWLTEQFWTLIGIASHS
jgi:hypothetical protein